MLINSVVSRPLVPKYPRPGLQWNGTDYLHDSAGRADGNLSPISEFRMYVGRSKNLSGTCNEGGVLPWFVTIDLFQAL